MNEMRDLRQRYLAALWDAARSLGTGETAHEVLAGLVEDAAEAEAQLAGLKLHLLHEARLWRRRRVGGGAGIGTHNDGAGHLHVETFRRVG